MSTKGMLKGTFEMGRWSGGGEDGFRLTVTDAASNLIVFSAEIEPAAVALAISGRGSLPILFEMPTEYVTKRVGMVRRVRRVTLTGDVAKQAFEMAPKPYKKPPKEEIEEFRNWVKIQALIVMKEEDGPGFDPDPWEVWQDGSNSQQHGGHTVIMERFDPPPTDTE